MTLVAGAGFALLELRLFSEKKKKKKKTLKKAHCSREITFLISYVSCLMSLENMFAE